MFQNVVCEMLSISSRPPCVNSLQPSEGLSCQTSCSTLFQCQTITRTSADLLSVKFPRVYFIEIETFSFKKVHLKMLCTKWQSFSTVVNILTHLPLEKIAAISQMFCDAFSWMKNFVFLIRISPRIVPKGPNDNNPALVQIMAWCWTSNKPLSESMLTQFIDVYMWQ